MNHDTVVDRRRFLRNALLFGGGAAALAAGIGGGIAQAAPPPGKGKPQPPAPTPTPEPTPTAPPGTFAFSGHYWYPRTSRGAEGPGPNVFASSQVWVDGAGALHLLISRTRGRWTCGEVINARSLGYGTYEYTLTTRAETLDANAVLGLFTWNDDPAYNHREMDVEFSRWGNPGDPTNAQYVVQPWDNPGNTHRFTEPAVAGPVTYTMTWEPGRVRFSNSLGQSWENTGPDVPVAGGERTHLNLWLFEGRAPRNGQPVEVVVTGFSHTPLT